MTNAEMNKKIRELRKLRRTVDNLNAEIEALTDEIKAEMTAQATDTLTGPDWKVTWKTVNSSRLDTTALKKALPDLVAQFTRPNAYRRFVLA